MSSEERVPDKKPKTIKALKELVSRFSLAAQVSETGTVTVENGRGNGQYLARAPAELGWLHDMADDLERQGYLTHYHFEGLKHE